MQRAQPIILKNKLKTKLMTKLEQFKELFPDMFMEIYNLGYTHGVQHDELWTMRNGKQISVDTMDTDHLRNTLKMIIRNNQKKVTKPKFVVNGELASEDAFRAEFCTCDDLGPCDFCYNENWH